MTPRVQVIEADLAWTGRRFEPGVQLVVGDAGRIDALARGRAPTSRHQRAALVPGFVNAHSHAFQRGLRGRGERFPSGSGNFWSWRQAMYELVGSLDEREVFRLSTGAFREMRDAGITAVGEFHYLHHATGDADYAFDQVVLEAAAATGIRVVLLNAYYATGGIGRPLAGPQRRFRTDSVDAYWKHMDQLEAILDPHTQSLGAVAHSIRAARVEDIAVLYTEAVRRGLPFHMHVEEQRREIEECVAAYGGPPMRVLLDALHIDGNLTAVHCTHTTAEDMTAFLRARGGVCVCPLTEANLGDGLPALDRLPDLAGRLSIGTDSNARISMLEEMRWLEYGQRLRYESRGALRDRSGHVAPNLLNAATEGGARALGVPAGRLAEGHWADLALLDLEHPSLAECDAEHLAEALVCGTDNCVVLGTYVGGRWRPSGDRPGPLHPRCEPAGAAEA